MTLQEVRQFSLSQEYSQYKNYLRVREEYKELFSTRDKDHDILISRLSELTQLVQEQNRLTAILQEVKNKVAALEASYRQKTAELEYATVTQAFYKESLEEITHQYLEELSHTLTEVYTTVYGESNKVIQLIMEDYRGKKVVRLKYLNTYHGNIYPESLDTDGGSAQIILGLIIAIYFILATDKPRFIAIDESLSALSTQVLQRFLGVLKKFATDLGFCFLIVDHSLYRMRAYVDQLFVVDHGVYRELTSEDEINEYIESTRGADE